MTEGAGRSPSRRAAFWDVCLRPVLSLLPRESVSPAAPGASVGAAGMSVPEPTAAREVGFSVTLLRAALGRFLGTDICRGSRRGHPRLSPVVAPGGAFSHGFLSHLCRGVLVRVGACDMSRKSDAALSCCPR